MSGAVYAFNDPCDATDTAQVVCDRGQRAVPDRTPTLT